MSRVTGSGVTKARSACALVMQDTGRQLFSDTLAGELTIGASHASGQSGEQLLADFDLANLGERHPLSLSGGQNSAWLSPPPAQPVDPSSSSTNPPQGWTPGT